MPQANSRYFHFPGNITYWIANSIKQEDKPQIQKGSQQAPVALLVRWPPMTHPPALPELQLPELLAPQFKSAFRKQYLLTQIQAPQVLCIFVKNAVKSSLIMELAFKAGNKKHSNGTPSTLENLPRFLLAEARQQVVGHPHQLEAPVPKCTHP